MNDPRQPVQAPHPPPSHSHAPSVPQPPRAPAPHPPPQRPVVHPPPSQPARPSIAAIPAMKPPSDDLEPIELIEDEEPSPVPVPGSVPGALPPQPTVKKIKAFGIDEHKAHHDWKRQVVKTGTGACRVRSFHGKYSEQGLEYLDNAINEWLDNHPEIEVKFVTSTVMTFEGKVREPALVLNVWY